MDAARVLVDVRGVELDEEMTLRDPQEVVELIDELRSLSLVLNADHLHCQGRARGLVHAARDDAARAPAQEVRLVHLDVHGVDRELGLAIPEAELANLDAGGIVPQGPVLADRPGLVLLHQLRVGLELQLQVAKVHRWFVDGGGGGTMGARECARAHASTRRTPAHGAHEGQRRPGQPQRDVLRPKGEGAAGWCGGGVEAGRCPAGQEP
mmetsp:Transcript_36609/g.113940  ORF Transcript_36609/g.113940 Transcript_36609/m.113940 type:complete len:209 (+) Transcript_36609:1043-1669(+)